MKHTALSKWNWIYTIYTYIYTDTSIYILLYIHRCTYALNIASRDCLLPRSPFGRGSARDGCPGRRPRGQVAEPNKEIVSCQGFAKRLRFAKLFGCCIGCFMLLSTLSTRCTDLADGASSFEPAMAATAWRFPASRKVVSPSGMRQGQQGVLLISGPRG